MWRLRVQSLCLQSIMHRGYLAKRKEIPVARLATRKPGVKNPLWPSAPCQKYLEREHTVSTWQCCFQDKRNNVFTSSSSFTVKTDKNDCKRMNYVWIDLFSHILIFYFNYHFLYIFQLIVFSNKFASTNFQFHCEKY